MQRHCSCYSGFYHFAVVLIALAYCGLRNVSFKSRKTAATKNEIGSSLPLAFLYKSISTLMTTAVDLHRL